MFGKADSLIGKRTSEIRLRDPSPEIADEYFIGI